MSQNIPQKQDLTKKSKVKKIQAKLMIVFAVAICLLTIFCLLISFSTPFRQWTIEKTIKIANNFLLAEVSINDIKFNRLQGISLEDIKIIVENDTLANIKQVNLDIAFESVFCSNTIKINKIELINPVIKLLRSEKDSIWNYNKIVKPSDTPPSNEPATTIIDIAKIIINDGKFKYWDSLASYPNDFASFRPLQMDWQNLNLNASNAIIDLAEPKYAISIDEISAKEANSLDIKKFALDAKLTEDGIEASNCYAEFQNDLNANSGTSKVKFDASMKNFNVFKGENDINNCIMSIDITVDNFEVKWVDNFAKIPIKLGKVREFNMKAEGTLNNMICKNLSIDTYDSHINLYDVNLKYLTEPEKLSYSGRINASMIKRYDLQKCLRSIDLSAIPDFMQAYIMNTKFFGTTDSVWADLDVRTGIGSVLGNAGIAFNKIERNYNIKLDVKTLNLGAITNNSTLNSNINCKVDIAGNSFDINTLRANIALDFDASKISDFAFDNTKVNLNVTGNDTLIIDNFIVNFINPDNFNTNSYSNSIGTIQLEGGMGIHNIETPLIDLSAKLHNIQLNKLLDDNSLPKNISSDIDVTANSIDIYDINADVNVDVLDVNYHDKSLLPFSLTASINNIPNESNHIKLQANSILGKMFDISVIGDFTVQSFAYIFERDMNSLKDFYHNRINSVVNRFRQGDVDTVPYKVPIVKDMKITPVELSVDLDIVNLSFLSFLIDSLKADHTNISANFQYKTAKEFSVLNINSLKINNFDWNIGSNKIIANDVKLNSTVNIERRTETSIVVDSAMPQSRYKRELANFIVDLSALSKFRFNNITFDSVATRLDYNSTKGIKIDLHGRYNSLISTKLYGNAKWNERNLDILLDTFLVNYQGNTWHNDSLINFRYGRRGFIIRKFDIIRNNKENISLAGRLSNDTMTNIRLNVHNFNVADLNELAFKPLGKPEVPLGAMLDSVSLVVNGVLSSPIITSNINITDIMYEKIAIGNFNANIKYENENISGLAHIKNNNKVNNELFSLDLRSIPVYLGLDSSKSFIIDNKPMDVSIKMNELQAGFFSPFVPSVSNIDGKLNGSLNIGGYLPSKYEYSGNINFENLHFTITPINMSYIAFGGINIKTGLISFENLKVKNTLEDLRNGELMANGKIELSGLTLKNIDIEARTKSFQILSDKTETAMPWFFGRMIIQTGEQPLRFYGTMEEPNLSGSVEIINADVKMPQILSNEIVRQERKFNYISKDLARLTITSTIDSAKLDSINSLQSSENHVATQKSLVDLLNIDLSLKIRRFAISLDLGNLGNIFARIGTRVPNTPLRYVKVRQEEEAKIYGGELEVLDGSTIQMYRTMSASGSITFPTARISRPTLNLTAEYKGRINTERTGIVNFSVFVNITGTAQNPKIELSYSVNGNMITGDQQQIQKDALAALTQGIVRGYNDNENTGMFDEIGTMFVSQIASKTLTDLLLKTGIIQSANIKFDDDSFNSANVSVSGMLWGVATWTFGGKIQDIASNYNVSIDIPLNVNKETLNMIMLQLNKSTDVNNSEFDRNAKNWEINLKFNGNW